MAAGIEPKLDPMLNLASDDGPVVSRWTRPAWATQSGSYDTESIDHERQGATLIAGDGAHVLTPVLNVSDYFRQDGPAVVMVRGETMLDLTDRGHATAHAHTLRMTLPEARELAASLNALIALAESGELPATG